MVGYLSLRHLQTQKLPAASNTVNRKKMLTISVSLFNSHYSIAHIVHVLQYMLLHRPVLVGSCIIILCLLNFINSKNV